MSKSEEKGAYTIHAMNTTCNIRINAAIMLTFWKLFLFESVSKRLQKVRCRVCLLQYKNLQEIASDAFLADLGVTVLASAALVCISGWAVVGSMDCVSSGSDGISSSDGSSASVLSGAGLGLAGCGPGLGTLDFGFGSADPRVLSGFDELPVFLVDFTTDDLLTARSIDFLGGGASGLSGVLALVFGVAFLGDLARVALSGWASFAGGLVDLTWEGGQNGDALQARLAGCACAVGTDGKSAWGLDEAAVLLDLLAGNNFSVSLAGLGVLLGAVLGFGADGEVGVAGLAGLGIGRAVIVGTLGTRSASVAQGRSKELGGISAREGSGLLTGLQGAVYGTSTYPAVLFAGSVFGDLGLWACRLVGFASVVVDV